jgi:MOSC domain-containing protein YiiM
MGICAPCSWLETVTRDGMLAALVHRGGLNARIVKTGRIAVGDSVERR